MPNKLKSMVIALLLAALAGILVSGCGPFTPVSSSPVITPESPVKTSQAIELNKIEEVWQIINREYVQKDKINAGNMTDSAIRGLIEALDDPYTSYMSPEAFKLSRQDLSGQLEGIGAFVGIRDGLLIIVAPMPDSPALKAGLQPGDTVLEVDGKPTADMSVEEAVLNIRGPRGTTVTLLILHKDKTESEVVKIVRAAIQVPSVRSEMKGDIAYIRIYHFSERTDEELTALLKNDIPRSATGIILDLRSNPGGYVEVVVDVASHFIKQGAVLHIVDNKGNKETLSVGKSDVTTSLPIIALSDNFSASGSEVLIGALQDYDRATIAGTTTYGKGSVNRFFSLSDGSGLYVTIARWLTPNGRVIEGLGIEPDIELTLEGDEAIDWAINYLKTKKN